MDDACWLGVAMTKYPCSAVILAGGESKRFSGKNKAYIDVGGQRVMDRLMSVFGPIFDDIILVTNDPLDYLEWNVTIVTDHFDRRSSLTGIHAGLFAARHSHAMVTACDMPFVRIPLVELLLGAVEPHLDVIIPRTSKGYEPLMAIYSKRCLKPMEEALEERRYQIQKIFSVVRKHEIEEQALRQCDPDLASFFNVNSQQDLSRVEAWLRRNR